MLAIATAVLVDRGKAAIRRVKTAGTSGSRVADRGLSGGEPIIVEGTQALRPGIPVNASPLPGRS